MHLHWHWLCCKNGKVHFAFCTVPEALGCFIHTLVKVGGSGLNMGLNLELTVVFRSFPFFSYKIQRFKYVHFKKSISFQTLRKLQLYITVNIRYMEEMVKRVSVQMAGVGSGPVFGAVWYGNLANSGINLSSSHLWPCISPNKCCRSFLHLLAWRSH